MPENSFKPFDRLDYTYKLFIIIALTITATVLASDIIIPLAFAAIVAVVMLPLVKKLERRGLGTALSITLVLLMTVLVMVGFIWLVVDQVIALVNDLPNLQVRFESYVNELSATLQRDFGISTSEQNKMVTEAMKSVSIYLGGILLTTTNAISTLVQIPIYIFLFFIYRQKFRDFFQALMPPEKLAWQKDAEKIVQGYSAGLLLVTLIIATLNTVGLLIVGIDHAIFFGILSGILTVIPYIGIIIGSLLPIIMALITKDTIGPAIGVVVVFAIVQFLEGNFITPRITGSKVSINALAAIIALLIGGKVLGIAGMILAVPGIGLLKILLSHTQHLKPFTILLEDTPEKTDPDITPLVDKLADTVPDTNTTKSMASRNDQDQHVTH